MKNKLTGGILTIMIVMILFVGISQDSYANTEIKDNINLDLYDNNNIEILKEDIKYFIDLVDEDIILNSSYNFSNKLNENYDFLTRFAISFIVKNEEYFDIIYGDNSVYIDDYGIQYVSNKYINMQDIYDVTKKIFGIDYYYITDNNLIFNDMILLVDFSNQDINMVIDNILDIEINDNSYDVYVKYLDNDFIYVYRLEKTLDNRLFVSNLSIEE